MTGAELVQRLARRRSGVLGTALLVPTWILLGALMVLYVVVVTVLAFAAVVVHTVRLFATPLLTGCKRVTGSRPTRAPHTLEG